MLESPQVCTILTNILKKGLENDERTKPLTLKGEDVENEGKSYHQTSKDDRLCAAELHKL